MSSDHESRVESVRQTFRNHYAYYRDVGAETRRQQLAAERSLRLAYAGRAAFELVQNAFDRCDRVVSVGVDAGARLLTVGNDGRALGVDPAFNYREDDRAPRRSDFHALCSLHTSNKSPDESIGNKGVGFRSVFSLGNRVQVWSRLSGDVWWGLELHRVVTRAIVEARRREDAAVRAGAEMFLASAELELAGGGDYPSFYSPLPLYSSQPPLGAGGVETLIVVALESADAVAAARLAVDELRGAHLYFLGERKPNVEVRAIDGETTWTRSTVLPDTGAQDVSLLAQWFAEDGERDGATPLAKLALEAEHPISRPGVAVAWPSMHGTTGGRLFAYLPTSMQVPFGIDVHADFQLATDRTSMRVDRAQPIGRYNRALLEAAVEIHFVAVLRHLQMNDAEIVGFTTWRRLRDPSTCRLRGDVVEARADLFRFLRPDSGVTAAHTVMVEHLEDLLFGSGSLDDHRTHARWAELARRFFREANPPPVLAFDTFWEASAAWLDRCEKGRTTAAWRKAAVAMCDALRSSGALAVPIIDDAEGGVRRIVPLPDRLERGHGGGRAAKRVFLRQGAPGEASKLHLPDALLDRGRSVTSYAFAAGFLDEKARPLGAVPLDRWALLQDLRQLPTRSRAWTPEGGSLSAARQYELLNFAAELFVAQFGSQTSPQQGAARYGIAWRASTDAGPFSEEERSAGRAVATLFLPIKSGEWCPARQLSQGDVHEGCLAGLVAAVPTLDVVAFLSFLGVSPVPGILFVEDGADGLVPPQTSPPGLVDAEGTPGAISLIESDAPGGLFATLRKHWRALEPALRAEQEGTLRSRILVSLRDAAWIPRSLCRTPEALTTRPDHVAPRGIVIAGAHPDRRLAVLWSISTPPDDLRELLVRCGAIPGLGEEHLMKDGAAPARRILAQLRELDLERVASVPAVRQGLVDLAQLLLDAIARGGTAADEPLHLLAYAPADSELPLTERRLVWSGPEEPAYIAADNPPRERIRRFFPKVPLVTATLGTQVVARLPWLGARGVSLRENVRHEPRPPEAERHESLVRATLDDLLPGLLAIAEVTRLVPQGVNPVDAGERWRRVEFTHVHNAWVDFELSCAGRTLGGTSWLHETFDDVLVSGTTILFDTPPGANRAPPLRYFGEALALAVLENPIVGSAWSQALAEFEAGGAAGPQLFDALLKKQGAAALELSYRRAFRPLAAADLDRLLARAAEALGEIGIGLVEGLRAEDIRSLDTSRLVEPPGGWRDLCESEIQVRLDAVGWSDDERPYRPRFVCREYNRLRWLAWATMIERAERLAGLALRLASGSATLDSPVGLAIRRSLDAAAASTFGRLGFDPAKVAIGWLQEHSPDPLHIDSDAALDAMLPELRRYEQVRQLVTSRDVGWSADTIVSPPPSKAQLAPKTSDQRANEDAAKGEIGVDAELALLGWVVATTRSALGVAPTAGWSALLTSVNSGTKAHARLLEAQRSGRLEDALHVAQFWGNAGFDLLGLELQQGVPVVCRYECKAIGTGRLVRVHLSDNEFRVYRSLAANGGAAGQWKLIGVEPAGRGVDLTEHLAPLLDAAAGPLAVLARDGFQADGLILTVARGGARSLVG